MNELGLKETENKIEFDEIDWDFIESFAKRMNKNKNKYPKNNWKKKMDILDLKNAITRHLVEIWKDNYNDNDEELGHILALSCNAMILHYQLKNF